MVKKVVKSSYDAASTGNYKKKGTFDRIVSWVSSLNPINEQELNHKVHRGEIWLIDFGENLGSETNKVRPGLIVQNDIGNKYSSVTIACPISRKGAKLPTHLKIEPWYLKKTTDRPVCGTILAEQVRAVSKIRLIEQIGEMNEKGLQKVDEVTLISLGINQKQHLQTT